MISQRAGLILLVWMGIWVFWFSTTQGYHPTRPLAVIVTTSLVVVYALAVAINHHVLIPRCGRSGRWGAYVGGLAATMISLTAGALLIIRVAYFCLWGPDADPLGAPKHFAIDLVGMAVHLLAAALVVWTAGWLTRPAKMS